MSDPKLEDMVKGGWLTPNEAIALRLAKQPRSFRASLIAQALEQARREGAREAERDDLVVNAEAHSAEIDRRMAAEARVKELEAEVTYEQERNRNNVLQYSQENERLREAIKEYLDVIDNAPDESSTSELREIVSQPPEPMQPCGHPESDRVSLTRCKHGCIYGCLLPSHDHLT